MLESEEHREYRTLEIITEKFGTMRYDFSQENTKSVVTIHSQLGPKLALHPCFPLPTYGNLLFQQSQPAHRPLDL